MIKNVVATELVLVQAKIASTAPSRNVMISSIKKLQAALDSATSWQGVDADAHKAALKDFCQKFLNCSAWMEDAGIQTVEHSKKLFERAMEDQKNAQTLL